MREVEREIKAEIGEVVEIVTSWKGDTLSVRVAEFRLEGQITAGDGTITIAVEAPAMMVLVFSAAGVEAIAKRVREKLGASAKVERGR